MVQSRGADCLETGAVKLRWLGVLLLVLAWCFGPWAEPALLNADEAQEAGEAVVSLNGAWLFQPDREGTGRSQRWEQPATDRSAWRQVSVPHTWQVEAGLERHFGTGWYARGFPSSAAFQGKDLQLEFDAINRDATVWVNGVRLGEHLGSGYTRFSVGIPSGTWRAEGTNWIVVRVDNEFSPLAIPYDHSFDWPNDGGMIRSARLRGQPFARLGPPRLEVELNDQMDEATVRVRADLTISSALAKEPGWRLAISISDDQGRSVVEERVELLGPEQLSRPCAWTGKISQPRLWHFDAPRLHRLQARLEQGERVWHTQTRRFGFRRFEVKPGRIVLNGEPMRLLGVEWMPGSDPRYGMAEDQRTAKRILGDMKLLNAVLTRFHWQQDDAVFDYCDEEGLLVQEEVPIWGKHPTSGEPFARLQEKHLQEMIQAHHHHPSIVAWGLANEIKGGSEAGRALIRRGLDWGRALDGTRPFTYASNTLHPKPHPDAAGLTDIIEWNEYFGTWYAGGVSNIAPMLDKLQAAFPGKGTIISEYGVCECDPQLPVGDGVRIDFLRSHTEIYRQHPVVAGAIYFSYNDYRTQMGDKGQGSFQQRVHGVTTLLGQRKPSWEVLRRECSPVRQLEVQLKWSGSGEREGVVRIVTRALENDMPAYTLRGYRLLWVVSNRDGLPVATGQVPLPDLAPGSDTGFPLAGPAWPAAGKIRVELYRPTGFAVLEEEVGF